MAATHEQAFNDMVWERYKGKVWKIERVYSPEIAGVRVLVEFRIPDGEADELEMYRRINRVIKVIAEGD